MRRTMILFPVLLLAVLAAGCGDDSSSGDITAADVAGRYYVATSVTGHQLVPGSSLTLSFNDSGLSAAAGCNTLTGAYTIDNGTLRMTGQPAGTLMACPPDLEAQDAWLTKLLTTGAKISSSPDGIVLRQGDVRIDLQDSPEGTGTARPGVPPIVGTAWQLRQVVEAGGKAGPAVPTTGPPTLEFSSGGRALVFTGCNRGGADAEVRDDGFIVFGRLSLTRMACHGNAAALEKAITAVLRGKVAAGFEGNDLSLVRDGTRLVYTTP